VDRLKRNRILMDGASDVEHRSAAGRYSPQNAIGADLL